MIRKWLKQDNALISEIEKLCFADPWSLAAIEQTFNTDIFSGYVYEEEGKVVGYLGALCFDFAEIALIAVTPRYQRRGIARALLNEFINFAKGAGYDRIYLEVRTGNAPARALYEGAGFIYMGTRKKYYEDGSDAEIMLLNLN